jgi:hypothetical protein
MPEWLIWTLIIAAAWVLLVVVVVRAHRVTARPRPRPPGLQGPPDEGYPRSNIRRTW